MAWRFRKRISFGKFLKFNISKSGVSTTIGPRGFSVNIGKKGVYRNVGIPGTGLYNREKIAEGQSNNQITQTGYQSSADRTLKIIVIVFVLFFALIFAIAVMTSLMRQLGYL